MTMTMTLNELVDSVSDRILNVVGDQYELLSEVGAVVRDEDGNSTYARAWTREAFVLAVVNRAIHRAQNEREHVTVPEGRSMTPNELVDSVADKIIGVVGDQYELLAGVCEVVRERPREAFELEVVNRTTHWARNLTHERADPDKLEPAY